MGKIMVFTVPENEEYILSDISEYLKMKGSYADISSVQGTILAFPNFEIDLYRREVRQNQKVIKLTDLEFRIPDSPLFSQATRTHIHLPANL